MKIGEIERGVEVPTQVHREKENSLTGRMRRMEVGDSMLVESDVRPNVYAHAAALKLSSKFICRTVAPGQYRIWRVE